MLHSCRHSAPIALGQHGRRELWGGWTASPALLQPCFQPEALGSPGRGLSPQDLMPAWSKAAWVGVREREAQGLAHLGGA